MGNTLFHLCGILLFLGQGKQCEYEKNRLEAEIVMKHFYITISQYSNICSFLSFDKLIYT